MYCCCGIVKGFNYRGRSAEVFTAYRLEEGQRSRVNFLHKSFNSTTSHVNMRKTVIKLTLLDARENIFYRQTICLPSNDVQQHYSKRNLKLRKDLKFETNITHPPVNDPSSFKTGQKFL